jgi:hypothetical protein
VLRVLQNPLYTGAYVYGRREARRMLIDGQVQHRVRKRAQDQWVVCLRDRHPAYISWDEFMENQRKLQNNTPRRFPDQHGAPHKGAALLQGLAICGRCGRKMTVHYFGRSADVRYECRSPLRYGGERQTCWLVSGPRIDETVAKLFLDSVRAPEIALGLEVVREAERQTVEIDRQWKLRVDRARYEAHLAERRYKAVDPDNRVVARTLEGEWNAKLHELDAVEREYRAAHQRDKLDLSESDRSRVLELAKDLRRVWDAETTTHADRKNLLRMLVQHVALTPVDVPQRLTRIQVLWRTGAVSDFTIPRPKQAQPHPSYQAALDAIRMLVGEGKTNRQTVAELRRRGLLNFLGRPWTESTVNGARARLGLGAGPRPSGLLPPYRRADGLYSLHGVAVRLGIADGTLEGWLRRGWLKPTVGGGPGNARWFKLDPEALARLQALKLQGLKAPHQRDDGLYSVLGVAARLGVSAHTVRYWMEQGWLKPRARGGVGNACWFKLGPKTLVRLQVLKLEHTHKGRVRV